MGRRNLNQRRLLTSPHLRRSIPPSGLCGGIGRPRQEEEADMPNATQGSVVSLWRYPVKSMLGEELSASEVTERGLLGDRAYALVDSADGKAATAKNPR
jgi:hypothetical protein